MSHVSSDTPHHSDADMCKDMVRTSNLARQTNTVLDLNPMEKIATFDQLPAKESRPTMPTDLCHGAAGSTCYWYTTP
jgi:Rad3-related DNA helicase